MRFLIMFFATLEIDSFFPNDEIYVSDRKVLFVFDKNIIQTRLIDGSYPDTARLIPLEFDYELDINRADLLNAIDRVFYPLRFSKILLRKTYKMTSSNNNRLIYSFCIRA